MAKQTAKKDKPTGQTDAQLEQVNQDSELRDAQAEVADYGRDGDTESLTKAVQAATDELTKAKKPVAVSDDEDDEDGESDEDGDNEGEDIDDSADADDSEDVEDLGDEKADGDEEAEDIAPPKPPTKSHKGKPANLRRSRTEDGAERFLKSVLLDDDGQPTAEAEVIEVSDVLTLLVDQFAKSFGEVSEAVGALQLQLDEALPLLKAMGHHQIQTGQIIKSLRGEIATLRKGAGRSPNPGLTHSMSRSMPGAERKPEQSALTKSQAAAGLLAAFQTNAIGPELYRQLAPALDTQGVDAVLGKLPELVAKQIRDAAASLNGNGKA